MSDETLEINGWTIYAYPLLLEQLEAMIGAVEKGRKKDPEEARYKLLAAVLKVAFEDILSDSTRDT